MTELVGFIAGALTIIIVIPQAIKSFKTKKTDDVSMPMFIVYLLGIITWITYGWLDKDMPVLITSCFELLPVLTVIYLKIKYDNIKTKEKIIIK